MKANEIMGKRIKDCRIERDLTQDDIAIRCGVNKQAVSKWENGKVSNMKRSTIDILSKLFNVSPMWLIGYDVPKMGSNEIDAYKIISKAVKDLADRYDSLDKIPDQKMEALQSVAIEALKIALLQEFLRKDSTKR